MLIKRFTYLHYCFAQNIQVSNWWYFFGGNIQRVFVYDDITLLYIPLNKHVGLVSVEYI